MKLTLKPQALETVTENKNIKLPDDTNAVIFQNAGTSTVLLDNGWTLKPDATLTFGSQTDINLIDLDWSVRFDTTGGSTNQLEIIVIYLTETC